MFWKAVIVGTAIGVLCANLPAYAEESGFNVPESIEWTIPSEFHDCAARMHDPEHYTVYDKINPFYVRADLDGDGKPDIALLIERQRDRKDGILVCFGNGKALVIFAGRRVADVGGEPMDDLKFGTEVDMWGAHAGKASRFPDLPPPPRQLGELLFFGKSEAWGRFIFWTGADFLTYQNGD